MRSRVSTVTGVSSSLTLQRPVYCICISHELYWIRVSFLCMLSTSNLVNLQFAIHHLSTINTRISMLAKRNWLMIGEWDTSAWPQLTTFLNRQPQSKCGKRIQNIIHRKQPMRNYDNHLGHYARSSVEKGWKTWMSHYFTHEPKYFPSV